MLNGKRRYLRTKNTDLARQYNLTSPGKIEATKETCLGAAKPDVEQQYKQICIECEMEYFDDEFSRIYLMSIKPIAAFED